jgi:thiamine biosynthesis lipoprotein
MNWSSKSEVRRCRPLLGTFVEIAADGLNRVRLQNAVNHAFAVVERIHRLMSVHDEDSELSLVNREALNRPVIVSRETFALLRRGKRMASESSGAFDYTVAPTLARWQLLPAALKRKQPGDWRSVELSAPRQVIFLHPLAIDLGGIAKGFAVDEAIRVLRKHGVVSALVNAGGDLRAFGRKASAIRLRHPARPRSFARTIVLRESALATSSPCFTERNWRGGHVSHLVRPCDGTAVTGCISVTVRARECWLADALTKVILNAPKLAENILARHGAEAFVLTA